MPIETTARRAPAMPREERRACIVAATVGLLLSDQTTTVTTRDIADAAGIAEGTIFRAFADKDEVLAAAVDAVLDPAPFEAAIAAIDPDLPLADRVVAATLIVQRRVTDTWAVLQKAGPAAHQRVRKPHDESPALVALFAGASADLRCSPTVAARVLRSLTLSVTHPMLAGEPMASSAIVDFFLHGVHAGPFPSAPQDVPC